MPHPPCLIPIPDFMREIVFLHKNAARWESFEAFLNDPGRQDPDTLASLFVQLTDDLSYAKTHYPQSKTTAYLQRLSAQAHQRIYVNKKEHRNRFVSFWSQELPGVVYASRKEMLVALVVFSISICIGVLSAANDTGFVRLILGDAYVNMTLENIQNGDPMAVYKSSKSWDMFLRITVNNVRVSFIAFVMGVVFSLGTGFVLFQNGVMLGAFQYLFYDRGLLGASMLTVYIHGALELSAIVIAGGAGFVLGNSILFPGTYTRLESFRMGARQGMKLVIGLLPIFIVAGFLEGFVTRYTAMPVWLSLLIIFGSLGFILWYFVVLPHQRIAYRANDTRRAA